MTQSEINIAISDTAPDKYFGELAEQCAGGPKRYGGIVDADTMRENFKSNCVPTRLFDGGSYDYDEFLIQRRTLMALKIKNWFETLS